MATDLTPELRAALAAAGGGPLELVDRETNEQFVIVRSDVFERLKALLSFDEPNAQERKSQLQYWGRSSGWEEPGDSVFDNLEVR